MPNADEAVHLALIEASGYFAALLVFLTFYTRTMLPLRYLAILSNVAFIVYAALAQLNPILVLHTLLLPLNIFRLWQLNRLIADVSRASEEDFSIEWLLPHMRPLKAARGEFLFRKGDPADSMYYLVRGGIVLPEVAVKIDPGGMIGEIGLFSPKARRTSSARCTADCEMLTISGRKVLDLYFQNPRFGIYLLRLITGRLIRDVERLKERA